MLASGISLGIMVMGTTMSAMAQNMSYGADNFYRSPTVGVHPITFQKQYRQSIAGNLFIHSKLNCSSDATAPAIVVGHPMGAVKEQSANLYAAKLAEQGFITTVEQRKETIATASRQRWVEVDGGELQYTSGTPNYLMPDSTPVEREFYDFYRTSRGEFIPQGSSRNLTTHPTLSSSVKFLNFYPFADIDTISPRPLLFISGDQAHSREFSEDAYARAAEPKQLHWVPRAGHVDLYDRVELIPFKKLADFFKNSLGGTNVTAV
ncbi:hypothetical protein MAJ_11093, partial [Metarhizium majus ARSEF 297]